MKSGRWLIFRYNVSYLLFTTPSRSSQCLHSVIGLSSSMFSVLSCYFTSQKQQLPVSTYMCAMWLPCDDVLHATCSSVPCSTHASAPPPSPCLVVLVRASLALSCRLSVDSPRNTSLYRHRLPTLCKVLQSVF